MNLPAIAAHMQNLGLGVRGQTIFVTEMPKECRLGILLMDLYSGTPIDHELPGWADTGFKAIVRAADYGQGYQLAWRLARELTIQRDVEMTATVAGVVMPLLMRRCLPFNEPKPYRRSEGGIWEFEVEFDCTYINL